MVFYICDYDIPFDNMDLEGREIYCTGFNGDIEYDLIDGADDVCCDRCSGRFSDCDFCFRTCDDFIM